MPTVCFSSRPSPQFGGTSKSDRLGYLSPAAQRLASNKLGIRTSTDKALKASYTPSPSHSTRLQSGKTPLSDLKTPTPGRSSRRLASQRSTPTASERRSSSPSLTDDLLHLPKRQKAQDFF